MKLLRIKRTQKIRKQLPKRRMMKRLMTARKWKPYLRMRRESSRRRLK